MRTGAQFLACMSGFLLLGCGSKVAPQELSGPHAMPQGAKEVMLQAADGAKVYGQHYQTAKPGKRVILCFHQAGSSAWEYADIAPRLVKDGWDVLAIDQRSGGDLFGHPNLTATSVVGSPTYMDAYQDLEAALSWAKKEGYKTIVACGSSYSASLTLKLAADHPEVSGILCFSPGEYFDEKGIVREWSSKAKTPRFFASTKEEATKDVLSLYEAAQRGPQSEHDAFIVNKDGVHGASTLLASKNPKSSDFYWSALEMWLKLSFPE